MKSLKTMVRRNLLWLSAVIMVVILFLALFFQVISTQVQTKNNADAAFSQVKQIISKNAAELDAVEAEYRETCLLNAEAISYIIDNNPDIIGNVEEFRQLAIKLEVDEIHIFDNTGRIFTGTHPEYFDFTFDSGEQMNFFKPMMEDKSLRLCQDITPNTAEGKLVQYSALWSADENYIVQVGMYPDAVLEETEKNELSYIFSLLQGNPGVSLYAINSVDGKIIGSSAGIYKDKDISDIGIELAEIERYRVGAHAKINGVDSYCIIKNVDGTLIGYVISNDQLYSNISSYTLILVCCLFVIAVVLVFVVQTYTDKYIIGSISSTNETLSAVAAGDLERRVDVHNSQEFSELSDYINFMIKSLLSDTDKISLVLNRTNLLIGVYEYNTKMKTVRFTERTPEILGLSPEDKNRVFGDYKQLQGLIEKICREPVENEDKTYRFMGDREMYIKLEEVTNDNAVLGIVMDVTQETINRKRAESERDHDLMTGLYNRRGMERQFESLFKNPDKMGCGAIIMVDSDNLKDINNTYGHAVGDKLLRQMATILDEFDAPLHLAARTGGDEFVLLIYGFPTNDAVQEALLKFKEYQDNAFVLLEDGTKLPLYFSYGYEMTMGRADHELMLSVADSHMYNSKRMRKKAFMERISEGEN